MIINNLAVKHKSFGNGTIIAQNGKYITVKFDSTQKVFVYPDIFEKFLTLSDGTVSEEILADIKAANDEKQAVLNNIREENRRARERGIVIPGKENQTAEAEDDDNNYKNKTESDEIV